MIILTSSTKNLTEIGVEYNISEGDGPLRKSRTGNRKDPRLSYFGRFLLYNSDSASARSILSFIPTTIFTQGIPHLLLALACINL